MLPLPRTTACWTTKGDGTFDDMTILHPVYTPGPNDIAAGSAELKLTAIPAAACPNAADSLLLTILQAPVVDLGQDTALCSHLTYTLDATTPDAVSYLWTPGNLTTPTIVVDSSGSGIGVKTVSVIVTASNGCQGTDAVSIQFKDCTGISELQGVACSLYPNPAKGSVTIELRSDSPRDLRINFYSPNGEKVIAMDNMNVNGLFKKQVDLNSLPQGSYIVEISDGNSKLIKKLVIAR
jgi:hypothetical protein